jgi:MFS family permease
MVFARRFSDVAFVGVAGVLVASIGPAFAFYFDALTYLASALLLVGLPSLAPKESGNAGFWARAREGVRFLWENRTIRATVGLLFTAACFGSVEGTLGVVLANKVLKVGPTGFGLIEATMAAGSIIGALIVGQIVTRIPRERLFLLGLLGFGLFEASIGLFTVFIWVLVAFMVSGVFNQLFIVPARSILQSQAPREIRGRLFAAFFAVIDSAQIIGALLGGLLEPPLGTPGVFILAGLMVSLATSVVYLRGGIPQAKQQAV